MRMVKRSDSIDKKEVMMRVVRLIVSPVERFLAAIGGMVKNEDDLEFIMIKYVTRVEVVVAHN